MAYFVVATDGVPELWRALETADLVLSEKDGPPARSVMEVRRLNYYLYM